MFRFKRPLSTVESRVEPVQKVLLPEVGTRKDLATMLAAVMEWDLPGFVIRSAGMDGVDIPENLVLRKIVAQCLDAGGYNFRLAAGKFKDVAKIQQRVDIGVGKLHLDRPMSIGLAYIELHTTTKGAGTVLLANSGPQFLKTTDRIPTYHQARDRLNELILNDQTDPAFIHPILYGAQLNSGDHVIFAQTNNMGPIWHRFDTTIQPREATASELVRV